MEKRYGAPVWATVQDQAPEVSTRCGIIRGENRAGVAVFRGIPYADRCDGIHRFLPPRPAPAWAGIRDCTQNGPIAMQFGTSISGSADLGHYFNGGTPEKFGCAGEVQDENCLVLDILTPGLDDHKRPVLVYIHGGGFASGSGTLVLGADALAREEDLVVVGINHRLNVFGYLYLGDFDPRYQHSGMAGMLDLVLALRWVQDNIAAFGGDAGRVTIMGESGGGAKVNTLMAMPAAKGLFCRAIVESGSTLPGRTSKEQGRALAEQLLARLELPSDQVERLRELPAEVILKASEGMLNHSFRPVADGINLSYQPQKEWAAPAMSADIPLLVGSSEDEMAVFAPPEAFTVSWETIRQALYASKDAPIGEEPGPSHFHPGNVDEVIRVFRQTDTKQNSAEHLYLKIISLTGHLGKEAFYQALAKARQGGAPVYAYLVAYDSPHPHLPGRRYAWHTADLPLQFGIVPHAEQRQLSALFTHAWAAFVRTGSPATAALDWPPFSENGRETMIFDDVCRIECDPLKRIHQVTEKYWR